MAFLNIRPDQGDSQQILLRKILGAINLWSGGVTSNQAQNIQINDTAGEGTIVVTPTPPSAGGAAVPVSSDQVGGYTYLGFMQPTVSLAAYADGDVIGTQQIIAGFRPGVGTGILQSMTVFAHEDAFSADFDIMLFRSRLSSSTLTDNAAPVFSAADFSNCQAVVPVAAADWRSYGTGRSAATFSNLGYAFKSSNAGNPVLDYLLWVVLVARGAQTYTASGSLNFWMGFLQD